MLDFDAVGNCFSKVTTLEAMVVQDVIPLIINDNFKDPNVQKSNLTSMQDDTKNYHYPALVGEPLELELNLTFLLEYVTELIICL